MNNYLLKKSFKTKSINLLRRIFKIPFIESFLVKKTTGREYNSFYGKLVPANYLYPANSIRNVERNGIRYKLDISDVVDHYIYFGFKESGKDQLYSFIKPGMTILDIGANMGETALNFSKRAGKTGTVIAFEPDKFNYEKALQNISVNTTGTIQLYNIGLGNENTTLKLYLVNEGNRGMNRILNEELSLPYTNIPVRKLDDFIAEHPVKQLDLIKIDVEGFEMNILKGAQTLLRNFKPVLFIELDDNNLRAQGSSAAELTRFLHALNYKIYNAKNNREIRQDIDFAGCHDDIYAVQN